MRGGLRHVLAAGAVFLGAAGNLPRPVHQYEDVALAPDGARVASVEGDETPSGELDIRALVIRDSATGAATTVALPCGAVPECTPSGLTWSADSTRLTFILRSPGSHAHSLYSVAAAGGTARLDLHFDGTLVRPRFGADGRLAVLATAGAEKEIGAVEAGAPVAGVLGGDVHEQRIGIVKDGKLAWASPADLFVYEYDWLPDGSGFAGTAAAGDGDNNWWVAKLYAFDAARATARVIHAPDTARQQLAVPRVSPDGKSVAFIGGIMSDFGFGGGDVFVQPLAAGAQAVNLTPKRPSTPMNLAWACDGQSLTVSELAADQRRLVSLPLKPAAAGTPLYSAQVSLTGTDLPVAASCASKVTAVVRQDFTTPPEIVVGELGAWKQLTHANDGLTAPAIASSISWKGDGHAVQGWLLLPVDSTLDHKVPLITEVHGGPASAHEPVFFGSGADRRLLGAGYALFLPNPRGSNGQGEAFSQANVKDFGHGDLRDILGGITAAEASAPIDETRLGIMGWSYGGYMTMWTVTQTNRFKAAVAGAGIANWQSYYGENGIDAWMIPYFGASVYDDPAVYARSAPISFIRNVHTPVLTVVGERDIECPMPQTEEFWHALNDLGRPVVGVVYPGEGHWMHKPEHVADFENRTVAWFDKYLK